MVILTRSYWNGLIDAINTKIQSGCSGVATLDRIEAGHVMSRSDITAIRNKLTEMCGSTFTAGTKIWTKNLLTEIEDAIEGCDCDSEDFLTFSFEPEIDTSTSPHTYYLPVFQVGTSGVRGRYCAIYDAAGARWNNGLVTCEGFTVRSSIGAGSAESGVTLTLVLRTGCSRRVVDCSTRDYTFSLERYFRVNGHKTRYTAQMSNYCPQAMEIAYVKYGGIFTPLVKHTRTYTIGGKEYTCYKNPDLIYFRYASQLAYVVSYANTLTATVNEDRVARGWTPYAMIQGYETFISDDDGFAYLDDYSIYDNGRRIPRDFYSHHVQFIANT